MKSHEGFSEWNLKGLVGLFTESESSRKYDILCTKATLYPAVPNSKKNCDQILREIGSIPLLWCGQKHLGSILVEISINCWVQSAWWTNQKMATLFYIQQLWNVIFTVLEIKYKSEKQGHLYWAVLDSYRDENAIRGGGCISLHESGKNLDAKSWTSVVPEKFWVWRFK